MFSQLFFPNSIFQKKKNPYDLLKKLHLKSYIPQSTENSMQHVLKRSGKANMFSLESVFTRLQ